MTNKKENQKPRRAYNGQALKEDEVLVPILVDDYQIELLHINRNDIRTWRMAGRCYLVAFYAVPKEHQEMAMQQYRYDLNEFLGQHRDARCLVPQEDGSLKVCPKKNGDNRPACADCPHRGIYEREDKTILSLDNLLEECGKEIADPTASDFEFMLEDTLAELLSYLGEISPRYRDIVSLSYEGDNKNTIIEKLKLKKSRGYQEINESKKKVEEYLYK